MQRVKPKSFNGQVNFYPDQDAILAKSGKMETTHLTIEIAKAEDTFANQARCRKISSSSIDSRLLSLE
jgi:hypothetical protein